MKPRVLITGANGMLGSALCRILKKDYTTIAFHRDPVSLVPVDFEKSLDITDRSAVAPAVSDFSPNIIIHCAGLINIDQCEISPTEAYAVNVDGTRNVAEAADKEAYVVYISTDQVYGESASREENNGRLVPVNIYGKMKYLGEQIVAESCPRHLIIRSNIFGWNVKRDRVSSAEWIYRSLVSRKPITLFSDYHFSPIYTTHLCDAIFSLIRKRATGIYNIGSSSPCSKLEFGRTMADVFGLDSSIIESGSINRHHFTAKRPGHLDLDVSKYEALIGPLPTYRESLLSFAKDTPR